MLVDAVTATRTSSVGEDALLLRELCHRAGNDCAVALAALRLVGSGRVADADERSRLVQPVTARLEASAALHRLLSRPVSALVDAGPWLTAVASAAASAASAASSRGSQDIEFDVPDLRLDGAVARRLVMVAAELVTNAAKYAVAGGVEVSARLAGGRVVLRVSDRGAGIAPGAPAEGGGLGSGIVADLVAFGGGRIAVRTGRQGTTVLVEMPADRRAAPDGGHA